MELDHVHQATSGQMGQSMVLAQLEFEIPSQGFVMGLLNASEAASANSMKWARSPVGSLNWTQEVGFHYMIHLTEVLIDGKRAQKEKTVQLSQEGSVLNIHSVNPEASSNLFAFMSKHI